MPWYEEFDRLAAGIEVLSDEPMAAHTSFRIGGPARRFARPADAGELTRLMDLAYRNGWRAVVMGNGSNLLAADGGVDALVIHTGRLTGMAREGAYIRAEAGVSLAALSGFAASEGLAGLAFAHGIPGSLGGGLAMNAGAYGGELGRAVQSVSAWFPDDGTAELTPEDLAFGYRHSVFSDRPGAILAATLRLSPGDPEAIRAEMRDFDRRRREKQPLDRPSAGSVFKRPPGHFAGGLIEQCGLKGASVGGARVSEKHAGFIVSDGSATCRDVLALIDLIRRTVKERAGVELEPEVRLLR